MSVCMCLSTIDSETTEHIFRVSEYLYLEYTLCFVDKLKKYILMILTKSTGEVVVSI